ncbi:MAG: PilZ domain-containing protein [Planctomycetaceae bacterium]
MAAVTERRSHARLDIPAAVVPLGHQAESPRVLNSRILNLSVSGAKLCCDTPIDTDRIWLAFSAERRMIVEAEIIWSDFASQGPHEIVYGISFTRMLSESEFVRLVDSLAQQEVDPAKLSPSIREREESLFTLFRGHTPQGARPRGSL